MKGGGRFGGAAWGPVLGLAGRIDLLVLGSGAEMAPAPVAMSEALAGMGIAIEPAATPVAPGIHALLLAGGRRIALAALPV